MIEGGGDKKSGITPNLVEVQNNRTDNETNSKLAKMAGVGTGTVARFNKVMNSDDEELTAAHDITEYP